MCLSALPQEQTSGHDGSLNFLHSCQGSHGQAMAVPLMRDTGSTLQALPRKVRESSCKAKKGGHGILVKLALPDTWEVPQVSW